MRLSLSLALVVLAFGCARSGAPESPKKALSCAASEDGVVSVEQAWVRAQPDQSAMSAAYFSVCNGTMNSVELTGVSTPLAAMAEFHETSRDANGVVSMAPIDGVMLAPGERVIFEPGGKHVMLMSLSSPIEAGAGAPMTFEFRDGTAVKVEAVAKSAVEAASENADGEAR